MIMDTFTPSLSVLLCCNADLTQEQFLLFTLYWIMWVWGWRNALFNKMKTRFSRQNAKTLPPPPPPGYLETQGHLGVHRLQSSLKDIFTFFVVLPVTLKVNQSEEEVKKQNKNKGHLFDRRLPPHIWSHPPTCGIEEEDLSKLRSWEVYFD